MEAPTPAEEAGGDTGATADPPPPAAPAPPGGTAAEPLLSCRLDTARILADALGCIATPPRKGAVVVLTVPENGGLRFAVEDTGCLQGRVVLRRPVFAAFAARSRDICARVALGPLLDCLNLFSGFWDKHATALQLIYVGPGHPLVLLLQVGRWRGVGGWGARWGGVGRARQSVLVGRGLPPFPLAGALSGDDLRSCRCASGGLA